ncbi:MAG TPA: serine hydrolase, partial [Thermodesulfobacteriota bacterium]|nr:serine hydrolase [Thermodesulfobacteriota bacterium]
LVDATPLEALPGTRALYSDLGFVTLGAVLEAAGDAPLEALYRRYVREPFGLDETDYAPRGAPPPWPPGTAVAATEVSAWRGGVIEGEVHDDTAWAMGGVAGHAGLFGTARDLHRFAARWLAMAEGAAGPLPRPLVLETFRRQGAPGTTRTLGWDTPAPEGSQAGTRLAPVSIGHLGYAGTSLWIDPTRRLVVVLLTNRVHPTRENRRILAFRPRFHDLAAAAFDEGRG